MYLGRAVVAVVASLAARQLGDNLPDTFCTPECRKYLNAPLPIVVVRLRELDELI
jgi:hypothetical protein